MGFPTTFSMNLGMLVGWAVLAPLAKHQGWAPGKVSDSEGGRGWILWIALAIMVRYSPLKNLLVKVGREAEPVALGVLQIAESIVSLLPICLSSLRVVLSHRRQRSTSKLFASSESRGLDYVPTAEEEEDDEEEYETDDRLVPMSWVWWGLGGSAVGGVAIIWALFGGKTISPWATAVGFLLACLLSLLG